MNTSVESLTHKMQRAAVGKMVDVVLSHADKDRQKTEVKTQAIFAMALAALLL